MRIVIYVRVSTQRQSQSQTIDQQIERLAEHIKNRNWALDSENIFIDDGYSGSKLNRPGLDRLREKVRNHEIDLILITAPDRLARKYIHQVLLIEELEKFGAKVEFLDRPMSQDPHDQLLLQIRGAVAEYERTLITDRMRQGRLMKMKAGTLLPWTILPFGYRTDPQHPRDPTKVRIEESEAAVISEIFAWYAEEKTTIREVCRRLQAHGIIAPKGDKRWSSSTINGILSNPVYIGIVYGERMRKVERKYRWSPLRVSRTEYSHKMLPPEQWIEIARIPAIISKQQYDLVQAKLAKNQQVSKRNNKSHEYLLRAMVSCGVCSLACTGRASKNGYSYYWCQSKHDCLYKGTEKRCQSRLIPVKQLDELVWRDLSEVIVHPESINNALARAHAGHWLPQQLQSRLATLRKGQASLKQQLERLTQAYLNEVILLEEFKRRRMDIEEKQLSLISQEQQLMAQAENQKEISHLASSITDFCQRIKSGLQLATFEQKRQLVELLIDRVVVTNEDVEIRYVVPTTKNSENILFCHLRSDYQNREIS